MADALVTQSCYPTAPGRELGVAFKAHVKTTGFPETFATISTSRPPNDGELTVLALGIDIDRRLRPELDMAPCPICSPRAAKWLSGGTLIWCEATSAIYCVGPTCGTKGWVTSRLTIAQNVFRQAEEERQNAADLAAMIEATPARLQWIDRAGPAVRSADALHARFAKAHPILRRTLERAARGGDQIQVDTDGVPRPIGRIAGAEFLRSTWHNVEKLTDARRALQDLAAETSTGAGEWAAGLSPTACAEKLKAARKVLEGLQSIAQKMGAARTFMEKDTLDTLGRWSASGQAPQGFRLQRTATTITITAGSETWRAGVGEITALPPLP